MAPWVTPLPRVNSTTLISPDRTIRSKTARLVGTASACMTVSMGTIASMANQIVSTNSLVKAIYYPSRDLDRRFNADGGARSQMDSDVPACGQVPARQDPPNPLIPRYQ